ncbi:ferrous iron transport protein B [Fibrobacter sp. UWB12]|uniref:ferrous iron transport protein B n=1 Tax=Fibrobacter sp. UWB12 TaxID=1896203 RepID=UPI00090F2AD0|nr:ferrous iron transport protein B [Fibrobacter sp. UWB12]SHK48143.1 ferrous iron transport protein B [Fibrobacter sp. UWB12]
MRTIALLGQPNSGKSTLFNALTGSHQHVGNWPGKTVERAEGFFTQGEELYRVVDLPGSYGLTANSAEEVVTRNFVEHGNADIVCIIVDASQLERSLYMLADFAGVKSPVMLVLNMMDVAEQKGKKIDVQKIEKLLNIPVLGFTAANLDDYPKFFETLNRALVKKATISSDKIRDIVEREGGKSRVENLKKLEDLIASLKFDNRERFWVASKLLENDSLVRSEVETAVTPEHWKQIKEILDAEGADGGLLTGEAKYRFVSEVLRDASEGEEKSMKLSRFDKIATHRIWGKIVAFFILVLTLAVSMMIAVPIIASCFGLQHVAEPLVVQMCEKFGWWPSVASFINGVIIGGLSVTVAMMGFVFAILVTFGLMEDTGYLARSSYVFDSWLSRLGLHGKAFMPLVSGLACTGGAVCGTRVLDTRGQRLFAMVLLWSIPCGSKVAVVLFLASVFFGSAAPLFGVIYVALIFASFWVSSKLFGNKLMPVNERVGMIMELPPYHKPHWKILMKTVVRNVWEVFKKAIVVIWLISFIFWVLSYSRDGLVVHSLLYRIGNFIEPFTQIFGMRWQLFISYLGGVFSKEASLGVMSVVFSSSNDAFSLIARNEAGANLGEMMRAVVSLPEALAFIFASMFNVPCVLTMGTTYRETRSAKWTAAIAGYYFAISLGLAFIVYHIALWVL